MKYHTIKETADTIGVTKPNVYQHYKHLKQSRGAKFSSHIKSNGKILLDNYSYNLLLKSFKKVNKNNNFMLVKSYQARITDLKHEIKDLKQDKQDLKHYLNQSQELQHITQLKLAKPIIKKHGFWYHFKHFFE